MRLSRRYDLEWNKRDDARFLAQEARRAIRDDDTIKAIELIERICQRFFTRKDQKDA